MRQERPPIERGLLLMAVTGPRSPSTMRHDSFGVAGASQNRSQPGYFQTPFATPVAKTHRGIPYRSMHARVSGDQEIGRATITPVGPRPYDITFRRSPQGQVAGAAYPGDNSTHYWTFYQEDQALKLRFLSTFAGNTQPLFLMAAEIVKDTWIFKSARPRYLEVQVKPRGFTLELEILLHGKRHVFIHLESRAPNR